jgi:sugar phosphate isomerase/epimerase
MKVVLGAAVLLGSAAWVASAAPAEPKPLASEKIGFRLAMQCWTCNNMSTFEAIDRCVSLGIRYVEMFPGQKMKPGSDVKVGPGMPADAMAELKKKLAEAGMKVVCFGVGGCGRGDFEFAKQMGIETLVCEPGPGDVAKIDKLCEEFGIGLALHNHPKPSTYWDPETVLKATQGCGPRVGACADTGHWIRSGIVPLEAVRKLKGRIVSLHLKDRDAMGSGNEVPWGTGAGDLKAVLAELKQQGFKGVFSIEYEKWDGEQTENIRKCVAFFEKTCAELAGK